MKRDNNYDLLRLISTLAVILLHINAQYYIPRSDMATLDYLYIVESICNIITRFSVPCFVMISGAFLLKMDLSSDIKGFYKKSFKKLGIPTLVFMIFLFIRDERIQVMTSGDLLAPVNNILVGSFYNYWYMYMLAGLYLIAPFISIIKKNVSKNCFEKMTIVLVLWSCISQWYTSYRSAYALGVISAYVSYFMLGSVLYDRAQTKEKIDGIGKIISLIIFILETILLCGTAFVIRYIGLRYYEFDAYTNFFSPIIITYSVLVFWLFSRMNTRVNIYKISKNSFYVYLLHTIVYIEIFQWIGNFLPQNELLSIVIVFVLTVLISFTMSYIVIYKKVLLERNNNLD